MEEIKVSIIIQSHLSDAALEMSFNPGQAELRINFVKFLVHTYPDTNVKIDPHPIYKNWYAERYGMVKS
jgi:hypothetical protein